jgi:hypothetical protein
VQLRRGLALRRRSIRNALLFSVVPLRVALSVANDLGVRAWKLLLGEKVNLFGQNNAQSNKKSRRNSIPRFRDSIASAYSLTGLPAFGRITLYLVIRKTSTNCRERIYPMLHQHGILGAPNRESANILKSSTNANAIAH